MMTRLLTLDACDLPNFSAIAGLRYCNRDARLRRPIACPEHKNPKKQKKTKKNKALLDLD